MKLRRDYTTFKQIVSSKSLQIFLGETRSDYYNLLAIDGPVTYECNVLKDNGTDQQDYELNIAPTITSKISTEPDWDDFIVTLPSNTQELHTYKRNDVTVQTVLTTYTSAAKTQILRIQKTRV